MKILKIIAILLTLFIICLWGFKAIQNIYTYYNGKHVYEIISNIYESTQNFKNQDNFYLSVDDPMEEFSFYYKDKKSKKVSIGYCTIYSLMNKNNVITIFVSHDSKSTLGTFDNAKEEKEYIVQNTFKYLESLTEKDIMECGNIKITEEIRDGIECYVLTKKSKAEGFVMVVDKENMLVQKYATINKDGKYSWTNYEYKTGTVADEDVRIEDLEGFRLDEITKKYLNEFQT